MKKWISFPHVEGTASRQAHADLPEGTYERELGREGFFGPAAHLYHRHPPTAWSDWEGPLRPRAFDTVRIEGLGTSPWEASLLLSNASVKMRLWRTEGAMDHLARNGDGTVSNRDPARGAACIAERRAREQIEGGAPTTPYLRFGDRVRIEMLDAGGGSVFGAIDQQVVKASGAG